MNEPVYLDYNACGLLKLRQANRGWELPSRQGGQGSSGATISDVKGEGRKGQPAGVHTTPPGAA